MRSPHFAYAQQEAGKYGWSGSEWEALKELWTRESSWNHKAANPTSTARGIPQAMMSIHFGKNWKSNPEATRYMNDPQFQIQWGLRYIKNRFGSPSKALAFHDKNNWY